MNFEEELKRCPIIAILRGIGTSDVVKVCDILYENGIGLLEIPLNSPDALSSIAIASKHCMNRQIVGAGTVLTPEDVAGVHRAGGAFVISPNTDAEVICETKKLGMISIPGFFTASEGFAAIRAGADYLKLFPAILGAGYIKDLQAVIRKPILAVGGVNAENIPGFLKVCAGVGIGGFLYKSGKSDAEIAESASALVRAVNLRSAPVCN